MNEEKKRDWKGVVALIVLVVFVVGYSLGNFFSAPPETTDGVAETAETLDIIRGTVFPYTITVYDPDKVYKSRLIFTLEKEPSLEVIRESAPVWVAADTSSKYVKGAYIILMDENYTVRRFLGNFATTELGESYHTRVAEWVDPIDAGSNTSAMVSWFGSKGKEVTKRPCIHTWDLETDEVKDYNIRTHHDYQIVNESVFVFITYEVMGPVIMGKDGAESKNESQRWDRIVQFNLAGNDLWEYSLHECIDYSWCDGWTTGKPGDMSHSNSLHFDGEKVYVNVRNTDTVFVIDYDECKLAYAIGKYGNFTMLEGSQWRHSHSYTKLNETDFLLFDNLAGNKSYPVSRVIHNRLNFDDMTCELVTEWVLPQALWCSGWGNAQYLPNGNILVTAGQPRHRPYGALGSEWKDPLAVGAAILEYTQDGELVMKIQFPVDWGICHGAYKEVKGERYP